TDAAPPSAFAYAFDEGTGSAASDISGNGNTGRVQGARWTVNARQGRALSFDGENDYVDLGNPSSLQHTGSMTWGAWVFAIGYPVDNGNIIAKSEGRSGRNGWELKFTGDSGQPVFGIRISGDGTSYTERYSKTVRALNTWYYVAAVYDTSGTLDIYVNGVLDNGRLDGAIPKSQFNPAVSATIGKRSSGGYFKGIIDNVRIYNRALSQTEI